MTQYIIVNDETYPVDTEEGITAAGRALSEAGINSVRVWASPHAIEWIRENGDPDGVETSFVVLADTDVDPIENGTALDRYQPGEEVEVLLTWAHGEPPAWVKGYTVERDEASSVIVDGGLGPARYERHRVRRR